MRHQGSTYERRRGTLVVREAVSAAALPADLLRALNAVIAIHAAFPAAS